MKDWVTNATQVFLHFAQASKNWKQFLKKSSSIVRAADCFIHYIFCNNKSWALKSLGDTISLWHTDNGKNKILTIEELIKEKGKKCRLAQVCTLSNPAQGCWWGRTASLAPGSDLQPVAGPAVNPIKVWHMFLEQFGQAWGLFWGPQLTGSILQSQ